MLACAVSGPSDKQESVRYSNLFLSISRLLFVCHIVISLHKTSSSVCVDSSVFRHNTKTTSSRRPRRDCAFFTPVLFHANIKPVQRKLCSWNSATVRKHFRFSASLILVFQGQNKDQHEKAGGGGYQTPRRSQAVMKPAIFQLQNNTCQFELVTCTQHLLNYQVVYYSKAKLNF